MKHLLTGVACAVALSNAAPVMAVVVPVNLAETSVDVFVTNALADSDADSGTTSSVSSASAPDSVTSDDAEGRARVSPGGVGASSFYAGASGDAPFRVTSTARSIRSFSTQGLDPNALIPLDFNIDIDGIIGAATGSTVARDRLQAGVEAFIRIDNGIAVDVVRGEATLSSNGDQFGFDLTSTFDGVSINEDVDAVQNPPGFFDTLKAVAIFNDTLNKPGAATVGFGSVFTVEMVISTFVQVGTTETVMFSDFLDTLTLDIAIGNDANGQPITDVELVEVTSAQPPPTGTPLPEPTSLWLTMLGFTVLGARALRRSATTPTRS